MSASEREQRAAEKARQQQPARVLADGAAQQVRHDEADETDDARHRDRAADRERRAADDEPLRALRCEPEARGRVLAERQASSPRAAAATSSQPGTISGSARYTCARLRSASDPSIQNRISSAAYGLGAKFKRERRQRGRERVDRDAGQHDRQEVAAAARERVQRGEREQRAHDRAERQQQRRGAREPEVEHDDGAERCAARCAEQPGLGERIAQQALQRGAAQAERAADEHGEQRPRQTNLLENDVHRLRAAEAERRAAAVAADQQRDAGRDQHEHAESGGERPARRRGLGGRRAHRSAARCSSAADSRLRGNPQDHSADGTVTVRCAAREPSQRRMIEHGVRERRLRAAIAGQHDELGRAAQQRLHRQAAPAVETAARPRRCAAPRASSSSCASESAPTVKPPGRTMTAASGARGPVRFERSDVGAQRRDEPFASLGLADDFRDEPHVALDVGDGALGLELDDAIAQAAQHRARERARVGAGEHDVGSELAAAPRPCRSSACAAPPRSRTATPRDRPRASSR